MCKLIFILITAAVAHNASGQTLVERSFDQVFAGDDPGELFTFPLVKAAIGFALASVYFWLLNRVDTGSMWCRMGILHFVPQ
jgi:hypothetical protein